MCTQSKSCRGLARLVGLQRADEVAAKVEARERAEMRARFLHVVFAEVGKPGVERRFHAFDRLRLADADQGDGSGVATRGTCCDRDALPHCATPVSRILRSS